MSYPHRTHIVNPKLGVYFGIFTSAFVAVAVLSLILESLGMAPIAPRLLMLAGPFALFATIGIMSYTHDQLDWFACGRRVPEFYSGLGLAFPALGATGIVGLTGAFFIVGFDALCITIGALAGFVVMAVLLAPFYRKFGAYTVPSYLGRRFDSRVVRLVAAAVLSVPMLLMLTAELSTGALAVARLIELPHGVAVAVLAVMLALTIGAGGMRGSIWSSTAESIAGLIALLTIATIIALVLTNLPFPQISYGPVMRTVGRGEASLGLPIVLPPALAFDLPGTDLQPVAKRFADALGSVGSVAFVAAMLTTMAGTASAPWLLPRIAATPGVYEARKSLGWATVLFGFTVMTIAALALFMRDYLIDIFSAPGGVRIPEWVNDLVARGAMALDQGPGKVTITNFQFARDQVLMSLPVAAGMPAAATQLVAAGIAAFALAAAGATALALGNILAEDVVNGLSWEPPAHDTRLLIARGGLAVAIMAGAAVAMGTATDPFQLVLWALALSGSTAFPVLLLSIWWKRTNAFGALAGLTAGFGVAVLAILAGQGEWIGLDSALAGVLGIPAGVLAAVGVTYLTPAPSKHVYEIVRDIRVPGGEILYDREMRALKRKKAKQQ